jgi:hypothetical protein
MERDEDVRVRCFLALDAVRAQYGSDLPFVGALSDGLATRWNQGTPAVAEYHYDYLLIVARPR